MAKRRILKRNIGYIAGDLFTDVLICQMFSKDTTQEKIDKLLTRILDMEDEFVRRAQRPDGNKNKALVKEYYHKLIVDLQTEIQNITEEINTLTKHE